jgi:hypothetical protein
VNSVCETDYAWAAGFLDGEGHFGIATRYRYPFLEAHQTATRAPMDKLATLLGGRVTQRRDGGWRWVLHGSQNVLLALMRMGDYLVVKRAQANLLMSLALMTYRRGQNRLDPVAWQMREAVARDLLAARKER